MLVGLFTQSMKGELKKNVLWFVYRIALVYRIDFFSSGIGLCFVVVVCFFPFFFF